MARGPWRARTSDSSCPPSSSCSSPSSSSPRSSPTPSPRPSSSCGTSRPERQQVERERALVTIIWIQNVAFHTLINFVFYHLFISTSHLWKFHIGILFTLPLLEAAGSVTVTTREVDLNPTERLEDYSTTTSSLANQTDHSLDHQENVSLDL